MSLRVRLPVPVSVLLGLASLACRHSAAEGRAGSPPQPHIVLILADDIGYGDLGSYGATRVRTPHLDRLATEGLRFTDAHSPSSMCSPTRYALLTGNYAWRGPLKRGVLSGVAPLCIPPGRPTLASVLRQAGYRTACVGKWHLGLGEGETDYNREIRPGPLDLGFDYFYGVPATGDRVPCVYVENRKVVGRDAKDPIQVSYREPVGAEPTGKDRPDLLTMKPSAGHNQTIVEGISRIGFMAGGQAARWKDADMADTLAQRAVRFIARNRRRPFFLHFASHDIHVPRVPHARFRNTSGCGIRGDVIQQLDASVGTLLGALDRWKLTDNTLVLFSSDNGGVLDDGYQDGAVADLNGHLCNGSLRGFKGGLYEGGHRVPLLARWPGRIRPGVTDHLACLVDLPATLAAAAGREFPADAGLDSLNLLPTLLGQATRSPRDTLVMHAGNGSLGVRRGHWKLIPPGQGPTARREPQLFHLGEDLAEKDDRAGRDPARVQELTVLLAQIRARGGE